MRVLLVLVLLAGLGLGTVAGKLRAVRRQREAVAALVKLDAQVYYGVEKRPLWAQHPPSVLRNWLGDDFFDPVTYVSLEGYRDFRDAEMIHLASLPDLQQICIDHVPVTDAGIGLLSGLTKLYRLSLTDVPITDAALEALSRLPDLTDVNLARTRVGDHALVYLGRMPQLQILNMQWTRVTDAGLAQLEGLNQLVWLDLSCTEITDAGLAHLRGLKSLECLYISETPVTAEGVASIKAALPGCDVNWWTRDNELGPVFPGPNIPEPKPRIPSPGPEN